MKAGSFSPFWFIVGVDTGLYVYSLGTAGDYSGEEYLIIFATWLQ